MTYECGSGWSEWVVPNRPWWMWWIDIKPACVQHDKAYEFGGFEEDRLDADMELHDDILTIYQSKWLWRFKSFRWRADKTADAYFYAVQKWGKEHFNYWDGV